MKYNSNPPLVSVRLMTFDHAAYIAEAIESCLMQKTDFGFEIVIGDDFSTDGTREICEEYAKKNPEKVKLLSRKVGDDYWHKRQKVGRLYNFVNIIENCSGKYIALLDGDDYWTDPLKMQKQTEFLENNLKISICFHNAYILEDNQKKKFNSFGENKILRTADLIRNNFIATASVMFRKRDKLLPNWFATLHAGDWGLHLLNSTYGDIQYLDFVGSVYRMHEGGIWMNLSSKEMCNRGIVTMKKLDRAFNYKYHDEFKEAITLRRKQFGIQDIPYHKRIIDYTKKRLNKLLQL